MVCNLLVILDAVGVAADVDFLSSGEVPCDRELGACLLGPVPYGLHVDGCLYDGPASVAPEGEVKAQLEAVVEECLVEGSVDLGYRFPEGVEHAALGFVVGVEGASPAGFEKRAVEHVIRHFDRIAEPKLYLDRILWKYEEEGGVLPPPQLSVASSMLAGMCTDILFRLATGSVVKTFPKFYFYSIADDVL